MGDIIFWVILIAGVAVWIITTLLRGAADEQANKGAPGEGPRRREVSSELEQFLEEVNRRRRSADRPLAVPPPEPRPEPEPPPRPVIVARPEPRRMPSPPPVVEVVPVALPAEEPKPRPVPVVELARREPVAPLALRRLLQSGEGLRTAVMLQEVLGPPRARRPSHR